MTDLQVSPTARHARTAVAVAFLVNGLCFASWISRTPAVRDTLGLSSAQLGLLLLCVSGGSIAGLPLSGPIVHRLGARAAVLAGSLTVGVGLAGLGVALLLVSVPLAVPGLVLVGLGIGVWDVAMNVEGADVERRLGRSLMPRLHAGFSLGTVAGRRDRRRRGGRRRPALGAGLRRGRPGAGVDGRRDPVFLADRAEPEEGATRRSGVLAAWREPRTLSWASWCWGSRSPRGRPTTGWPWRWSTATARARRSARSASACSSRR